MQLIFLLIKAIIALAVGLGNVIVFLYIERKILADTQVRFGPMRVGYHGLLQPIADALKLLLKEDIIPAGADKLLFYIAPIVVFAPSYMLYFVIPISKGWVVNNLNISLFYLFGILTVLPVGVLLAGWSSFSKYSLLGGLRAAAQQISYEIPLLLSILGIVMIEGNLSLVSMVNSQSGALIKLGGITILPRWYIFLQPLGFLFYFIAVLADQQRTPFDIPEAESELVQGYFTEYSSMKFALFFLAEYSNVMVLSAIGVLAFLGGWNGPFFLPPVVWFFLKTYILVYIVIWLRATLPRVRIDQLMNLGWKILLPLTLINIIITGFLLV